MGVEPSIQSLLKDYRVVGIDTAVFVYHFEERRQYLPFTNTLFEMVERGDLVGVTSTLTLLEILVKPKRIQNQEAVEEYLFVFKTFPNLRVRHLDFEVAEKAAEVGARYGVKTPDAIQIATALVEGANAFITNDKELKKIKETEVVVISETLSR